MGDSHTMCDSHIGDINFLICLACEIGLTSVSIKLVVGQSIALHAVPAYNTATTTLCEAPAQLLHNLESIFVKVPEGGGANWSTRRKPRQPAR